MIGRAEFWKIIDEARSKTSKVTDIPAWLMRFLKEKPVQDIVEFEEEELKLRARAYDGRLWAAAALMMNSCSDDTFDDFRGWLIAQGRAGYELALENPDTLAELDQTSGDSCMPVLTDFGGAAIQAYREKTGASELDEIPLDYSKYKPPLSPLLNEEFMNYDSSKLSVAFPRLYARYEERLKLLRTNPVFKPLSD